MRDLAAALKRNILAGNPLLVSALGAGGAVLFSCGIVPALTAALSEALILIFAVSVMFVFRHFVGKTGSVFVFFASAAAAASACGAAVLTLLPDVWASIGAFFPLLAVGSIPLATAYKSGGSFGSAFREAVARAVGFGAAVTAVAVLRFLLGLLSIPASSLYVLAFILIGILAASLNAVCGALGLAVSGVPVTSVENDDILGEDADDESEPDADDDDDDDGIDDADNDIDADSDNDIEADVNVGAYEAAMTIPDTADGDDAENDPVAELLADPGSDGVDEEKDDAVGENGNDGGIDSDEDIISEIDRLLDPDGGEGEGGGS